MKKIKVSIALLVFAFALVSISAVSAQPNGILQSELSITLVRTSSCTWIGTVSGDINGDFCIKGTGHTDVGRVREFSETWVITTAAGTIGGFDEGVWSFSNFKWVANGGVISATGAWSNLVGFNFHYSGTTSEVPPPPGTSVTGTGTMILVPSS